MTPPFRSPPSTAGAGSAPRGCGGDRCVTPRDAWPLHHVRHDGVFCRLCSSCVLLYHPGAFCSACLHLLPHGAAAQEHLHDPALAPPGPTAACSTCGLFVAHVSCVPDPVSFVCAPCTAAAAAAAESTTFCFAPSGGGRRVLDERSARVLLIAARLAHESIGRAAAAARKEAENQVREAAIARKRARDMLDAAFRVLEAEARDAKKPAAPQPAKKKTPKSSHVDRDRDKLLKLNAIQQPALAFAAAAAAAAAASSMPLSIPSPTTADDSKSQVKQEAQGSTDRSAQDDRKPLFGSSQ